MKLWLPFAVGLALAGSGFASTAKADGAGVYIYGVKVIQFRVNVGNLSPAARASILASNIEKSLRAGEVSVRKAGKNQQVLLDGKLILTVTPREARTNRSSTITLATEWARNIRAAILTPPLKVETDPVRVPLGANRFIKAGGTRFASAQIESSDSKVLKVGKVANGIAYKAIGYGKAQVAITAGDIKKYVSVSVLPMGANLPQNLVAVVSGIPASEDTVQGALESAVRTQLGADPKAELKIEFPKATHVNPGESRTFTVRVRAVGPEVLPAEGPVFVNVKNVALGRKTESVLWYCNEPENLYRPGLIFAAPLRPETPSRMLYHHINQMSDPVIVTVEAINNSDLPARLMVIPGDSKPDTNPVLAGVQAADQFMKGWSISSGEVIQIPPKSRLPIAMRRLFPGQTMSGLCYLRLLDEGPDQIAVRTEARNAYPLDARWSAACQSGMPWRYVNAVRLIGVDHDPPSPSIHIYPNPYKVEEGVYQVGGKYAFFRIGEVPIARADKLDKLSGNFGVTYTINARMENPTTEPSKVEVVFEASAGYSGAVFYVNGEYVKTPLLQPKTEAQIAQYTLEPGASRNLSIVTVPLSGSSYPATLTIRPVDHSTKR